MGLLDRLKLWNREARKYTYAIYEYVQSRTGRWMWKRRAVIEQPVNPYDIEDWPSDGYYQMRAIDKDTGTQRVLWTVYVEGGAVVEEDPELPTNTPTTRQHTPAQAENPFAQIEQALQMLAYYRELFKKAGLIQDQRERLMETLMFLKEVQELKNTARDILGGGESKLPENAPWWVHLLLPAVQSFSSLTSMMTQAYNPYLQPTYPYQYQQPQPQPQQEEEALFTPPSPQTVKQVHKPRRKEERKEEPKPEPQPEPAQVEEVLDVDLNVDIPAELEEEGGEEE